MISVKPGNLPAYLKESALCANLQENDDEEINVPADCCKLDTRVTNVRQMEELLRTLRFWGVDNIPLGLVRYAIANEKEVWESVAADYVMVLPYIAQLIQVLDCEREHQVCKAVEVGSTEIMRCLLEEEYPVSYKPYMYASEMVYAVDIAALNGRLDLLKSLHHSGCKLHISTGIAAASAGQTACLKYAVENGCGVESGLINFAFASGDLECLKYVHETMHCQWTLHLFDELKYDCENAPCTEAQLLLCLQYALARGCPHDEEGCVKCAQHGFASLLQYLHEHGSPWDEQVTKRAARHGQLNCLQYALDHGCPQDEYLFSTAMLSGNTEMISYLRDSGHPWPCNALGSMWMDDSETAEKVIVCLKHALTLGCPRDPNTCRYASEYGWLDVLIDAYEHGCAWDHTCTQAAAGRGHLDCLVYLHEQGCEWDTGATTDALVYYHYDCLKYAVDNGCPTTNNAASVYRHKVRAGEI